MSFDVSGKLEELAAALSKVQGALKPIPRNGHANRSRPGAAVAKYTYDYATLDDIWAALGPLLSENGLSVIQTPTSSPINFGNDHGCIGLTTCLLHVSGAYISDTLWLPISYNTPQSIGSAITYARRYALCAVVGVVAEADDDGQAAQPVAGAMVANTQAPATVVNRQTGELSAIDGIRVLRVEQRAGNNKTTGKPYTKYTIHLSDGVKAGTFKSEIFAVADKCMRAGTPVTVVLKDAGQFGTDLEAIEPAQLALADSPGFVDDAREPF